MTFIDQASKEFNMERPSIREQALEWAVRTCALGEDAFAILGRAQLYEEWLNSPEKFDVIQKAEGVQHDEEQIFRANRTAFANDAGPNMEPPLCEHTLRKAIETARSAPICWHDFETPRENGERGKVSCIAALDALLPKKDRAKELVDAWDFTGALSDRERENLRTFANHLISNNLINEKGAL